MGSHYELHGRLLCDIAPLLVRQLPQLKVQLRLQLLAKLRYQETVRQWQTFVTKYRVKLVLVGLRQ